MGSESNTSIQSVGARAAIAPAKTHHTALDKDVPQLDGREVLRKTHEKAEKLLSEYQTENSPQVNAKPSESRQSSSQAKTQTVTVDPQQLKVYIAESAKRDANANFKPSELVIPDEKQIKSFLSKSNLSQIGDRKLSEEVLEQYKQAYLQAYEDRFMQMSWISRQYYSAAYLMGSIGKQFSRFKNYVLSKELIEDVKSTASAVKNTIDSTVKFIGEKLPGLDRIWGATCFLAEKGYNIGASALSSVYEIVRNPKEGIRNAWGKIRTACSTVYNADWKKIGSEILAFGHDALRLGVALVKLPFQAAGYVIAHRKEIGNALWTATKAVGSFAVSAVKATANGLYLLATNPKEAILRAVSFCKELSDVLGITDLCMGLYHGALAIKDLAVGNPFSASRNAKEATRAVRGAITAVGEFTGVSDLCRAAVAYSKGDYAQAAMYAAIGGGQLALIVTTFGLANILSTPAKKAALKGAEVLVRKSASELLEVAAKKVTTEVLDNAAKRGVLDSVKQILKTARGKINDDYVKKVLAESFENISEKLMRDFKLDKLCEKSTFKLLKQINKSSLKDLTNEFVSAGIAKSEAKYMAKSLKKALGKPGRKSRYHGMLEDCMTDVFTKEIVEDFMGRGLRQGFERVWNKAVPRIQNFHGLSDDVTLGIKLAGKEGFEEGVEQGIRKVVKQSVAKAFARYRKIRIRPYPGNSNVLKEGQESSSDFGKVDLASQVDPEGIKTDNWWRRFRKKPEDYSNHRDKDGNLRTDVRENNKYYEA